MIVIKIDDKEFNCITTLRVAMNIQAKFKKPYIKVLDSIEELNLEEQLKVLYCGIELGKNEINFEDFKNAVVDSETYGMEGLTNDLERFINSLQYPGLSEEEVEKKLQAKLEKYKKMRNYGI